MGDIFPVVRNTKLQCRNRIRVAKACRYIQLYVKLLETNANGYGYCVSCGKLFAWSQLQIDEIKALSYKYLDCNQIDEIARIYKQKCKDLAKTKNFAVNIPS